MQAASDVIKQLSDGYEQEAQAIKALQTRMNAAWTGSSGDAATAGANPLARAFIDSAPPLDTTTKSMHLQSEVFDTSKAKVVQVPPAPAKPSAWSVGLKAAIPIVGPAMAAGDIGSYEQGVAATNTANENNVRVMQQYTSVTNDTRGSIPMDYKTLPVDGASVGLAPANVSSVGPSTAAYADRSGASAYAGTPTGSAGTVNRVGAAPSPDLPGTGTSSGHTSSGPADPVRSGPDLPRTTTPGGGHTNTSQYVPGVTGYNDTTAGPGTTGPRSAPGTGSYNRNSAAGRLYDSEGGGKAGSVSDGGAREGGESQRSPGGGKGSSLGAGKSSGVGSAAAAEEAAASRSTARGASGTPVGAAGQRGQGADDEEHQRPDYLIEPDPDSLFGTDVHATPPVIGE